MSNTGLTRTDVGRWDKAQKKLAKEQERSSYERSGATRAAKTRAKIFGSFVRLLMPPGADARHVDRKAAASGTTVGLVTIKAEVSNASFYKNFKSVDDLLEHVTKQMGEALWKKSRHALIKLMGSGARFDRPHLLALNIVLLADAIFRYPGITKVENATARTKAHINYGLVQSLVNRDARIRDNDWKANNEAAWRGQISEALQLGELYASGALAWFELNSRTRTRHSLAELLIRQAVPANFPDADDVALKECLALIDQVYGPRPAT